jgi:hypothetical protein
MSIAVVVAMTIGMFAVLVPVAGAVPGAPCKVTNLATGQIHNGMGPNLQTAIDQAASGTRLRIRGVCVGNYAIGNNLKLLGRATAAYPIPTIDGNDTGTVITVNTGRVVISDLTISNGQAEFGTGLGGGIYNAGTLTLTGSSSVSGNDTGTGRGGGIYNDGTLDLYGSAAVLGNGAGRGGGIFNTAGHTVRLHGSSSVWGNHVFFFAGGIYNEGTLSLHDRSSISENHATDDFSEGGGISNFGTTTLNDSSSVWGNEAGDAGGSPTAGGGGIYNEGTLTLRNLSSVRGNTTISHSGGGGITNAGGTVTMNGASSIRLNTATDANGGGIANGGTLIMNGASSIRRNIALNGNGGGIFGSGILIGAFEGGNVSDNTPDDIFP